MLDEGTLRDILDSQLTIEEEDERFYTAIKAALWCIQEDMHLRPSMTKVADDDMGWDLQVGDDELRLCRDRAVTRASREMAVVTEGEGGGGIVELAWDFI
ncbi:hypothetical protein CRYUN_Cryun34aG0098400 [Craigia yunnanensis]